MPVPFDRFRFLNDGDNPRFRNESDKVVYLTPGDGAEPPIAVLPGQERPLPVSPEGETVIEIGQAP